MAKMRCQLPIFEWVIVVDAPVAAVLLAAFHIIIFDQIRNYAPKEREKDTQKKGKRNCVSLTEASKNNKKQEKTERWQKYVFFL